MSSSIFNGDVTVPGDAGRGLSASLSLDAGDVTLTTEDDVLGTWSQDEYEVQPTDGGEFRLTLGGEDLLFRPEAPAEFANAVLPAGTPIPLSEEDAHHESWQDDAAPAVPEERPPSASAEAETLVADLEPEVVEALAQPPDRGAEGAEKASHEPDPGVAMRPEVHSNLDAGIDDGIITAGFLRAIVVVAAALITFAVIAILLV